jgi:undecaprenyl-diphosphatase
LLLLHLIILSVVQGITEFLPISSSGHLILLPHMAGWQDQGINIDIAVHVGTLGAVLVYFHRDLWAILRGFLGGRSRERKAGRALGFYILVSLPPVLVAGGLLAYFAPEIFRSPLIVAWTMLGFGVVLWLADRIGMTVRRVEHMTFGSALIIGLAQVLALLPGTSRSGITMTAARFIGMERPDAARFSLLLSIPTIIAAGTLSGIDIYQSGNAQLAADAFVAAGLAFIFALIAIALMMAWLRRASFTPFVVYRILLGGFLLAVVYGVL